MSELTALLQPLCQELAIPFPVADTRGQYALAIGDLSVTLRSLEPGIGFYSEVGKCPLDGQEAFLQQMMLANLFGQGTQHTVLGLTPDGKTLTLSLEIDYNLTYKDFRNSLEDFLNAADFWHSEASQSESSR